MMIFSPEVQKAAEFLECEIRRNPYSEVAIRLVVHDGSVKRTERTVVEKEQASNN